MEGRQYPWRKTFLLKILEAILTKKENKLKRKPLFIIEKPN